MKIILLIGGSYGIARYGLELAKALSNLNKLLLIIPNGVLDKKELMPYKDSIKIETFEVYKGNKILFNFHYQYKILNKINEWNPDIIHNTAGSVYSWYLLLYPFLNKYKLIFTEHEPKNRHSKSSIFSFKNIQIFFQKKLGSAFIVHGKNSKNKMIELGYDKDKVKILPHGYYDFYNNKKYKDVNKCPNTILSFGAFRPDKGIEFLPEIVKRIGNKNPKVKFIIAGNKEWPKELNHTNWPNTVDKIIISLSKNNNCQIITDYIPDDKVEKFFRKASIVILPYKSASQSGVAAIAFAFRCIVTSFKLGDIPDVIKNNYNGILIDENNLDLFIDNIVELLNDKEKISYISKNSYEYAKKKLNWNKISIDTFELYDKIKHK